MEHLEGCPAALATLHGSRVKITNLGDATCQGDIAFFGVCEKLGAASLPGTKSRNGEQVSGRRNGEVTAKRTPLRITDRVDKTML